MFSMKQYRKNQNGNMAIMLAILLLPLLIGVGIAIDFMLLTRQKSNLQDQFDTAVLAAIKEGSESQARSALESKLQSEVDNFQIVDFQYNKTGNDIRISSSVKSDYALAFGGILSKEKIVINVSSTVVTNEDVVDVLFRPINAKGQYYKDISLKVIRPSGVTETLGEFGYDPTATSPFTVSSSDWISLGEYEKIILEMRVHYDVEASATANLKSWYGDDQTFAVDEAGFSEHLWVDGVQLRPDETITNDTLFDCSTMRSHNWEDVPRGYPTTDTPDFEFEILSRCGATFGKTRIVN